MQRHARLGQQRFSPADRGGLIEADTVLMASSARACFPPQIAGASLKRRAGGGAQERHGVFSPADRGGLIEAKASALRRRGFFLFSPADRGGLIEARSSATRSCASPPFSPADRGGLIEASSGNIVTNCASVFSPADRGGLIEAAHQGAPELRRRDGFPPQIAGASLKRARRPRGARVREGFPPQIAGASLKPALRRLRVVGGVVFPRRSRGPH